ncbi:hypothetical protein LCM20_16060 [Halobacillus litoralis]|uniref:IucA/IucC family protein n=1 Tax=Halobacillus litoralis TaxID=45668 RepID=UPI001CD49745|nr:IucA/IucC family protein [Halobacillus litoralis]MCA0972122.1 hypothetical protein [Halobacillus litoralis]
MKEKKEAERSVLHQLVQALIREEVMPYEWVTEHTLKWSLEDDIFIRIDKRYTLGHLDIQSVYTKNKTLSSPAELLERLSLEKRFEDEIHNSVHNYALALESAERRRAELGVSSNVFEYINQQKEDESFSPLTFLEQWVIQGHTIHPGSRTRLGLNDDDLKAYAPEWEGRPEVIPVAVRQGLYNKTGASPREILFEEYPEVEHAFYERGLDPESYELIPVHPWQWEHTIQKRYQEALRRGDLVALDRARIPTAALISFRTLAPLHNRKKHHIKTAVNIQMTSAVRTVSPASTKNGPTLSKVLCGVFDEMDHPVSVMKESAGIHYVPGDEVDQKNLAAILRENPERTLKEGETAISAASLMADSPFTGDLILEDAIEYQQIEPEKWIRQYASVLLPGLLTLMTKYGVSMEAHLQNVVVVFENARPKRVILRDYGGVRVMNDRLKQVADTEIDPSTNLLTDDVSELISIFSHALLHNHLGEMIVALTRKRNLEEADLWAQVVDVIKSTYLTLREETPDAKEDEALLFSDTLPMKALVKMRLSDRYTDNMYVQVHNPLRLGSEVPKR